ncbi:polycystin-2-like protein 2 isoform X2 [Ambystoma mexicanum]|uniref:polycystin-2-like protein 2 isoform X2 n=1 Tax=Ambystoma mexicanum TaxID=8296 RepID=UPI0037E9AF8F
MTSSEKLYSPEAIPRERRISVHRRVGGPPKPNHTYGSEVEMKSTLQELLIYCIFIIDICILAFGMVEPSMYTLNTVMKNLFLEMPVSRTDRTTFNTISSMADFWKYAEGPLLDGLYWTSWYNTLDITTNGSFIYYENLLLGVAQIRQVKVRDNTCRVHPYFRDQILNCYHSYSSAYEDRDAFGSGTGTEWTYNDADSLQWQWGYLGTYFGGGFKALLSRDSNESFIILEDLKEKSWLTRGTRAAFIDFSVYNGNLNLFCVVRLLIEFPATGGAIPSSTFYAVKLLRYVTLYDYFLASCEVLFCLFICAFIYQECMKCRRHKCDYFKSLLNWLEMVLILISLIAIAFNLYRTAEVNAMLDKLLENPDSYPDFLFLAYWQTQYNTMVAVSVFFAWIKIFKYISFNKTMSQLSSTLSRCAKDIMGFAFMFFIIFFAYAQLANLTFGTQIEEFSTFPNCIFTQFRIILGDFNFASIELVNRILGPIYFISYVFFVFFVLLNMFLAIINDTYSDVKADFSVKRSEFEIGDLIRRSYERALVKLKLKKARVEDNLKNAFESGSVPFEPFQEDMSGYSGKDVYKRYKPTADGKFSKYDLDDKENALAQRQKWKERLWQNYYSRQDDQRDPGMVTQEEYQKLVKHAAELEKKLSEVTIKVDDIVKQKGKEPESKDPGADVKAPGADVKAPGADVKAPGADVKAADTEPLLKPEK